MANPTEDNLFGHLAHKIFPVRSSSNRLDGLAFGAFVERGAPDPG